jgi:hypothetical protein
MPIGPQRQGKDSWDIFNQREYQSKYFSVGKSHFGKNLIQHNSCVGPIANSYV